MSKISQAVATNKQAAVSAAVLETGRVANNTAVKLIKPKLPMVARGYADTPFGKLAIANATLMAVNQFKPDSEVLQRIANGMVVAAYQEIIQSFDIESMLESLVSDTKLVTAFKKQMTAESALDKLEAEVKGG